LIIFCSQGWAGIWLDKFFLKSVFLFVFQVVAESVVRAVVSVHAQVNMSGSYPVTNYTTRVESYNVLPPE
jgi:hypothetical protein